ncbi:Peptidase family M48 [Vreelandella arcis]|uniref:Peptidase family M48 n=1 Tax=Vreelandella arcis TaxID=416873 RepID=A0A1G9Y4J9_9GAMM|nr:Peptidase family M48 [Halomonas arcis]
MHTGLLQVAETPAQLAAVMGHEVAHVLADHNNERLTQPLGIKAALLVVGLLGEADFIGLTVMAYPVTPKHDAAIAWALRAVDGEIQEGINAA